MLHCTMNILLAFFILFLLMDEKLFLESKAVESILNGNTLSDGVIGGTFKKPDFKIIKGWSVTSGLIPYQAIVRSFSINGNQFDCGGTLISERHVLTAAHCLSGVLGTVVILGSINKNIMFAPGVQTFLVTGGNYVVHPDYNDKTLINDIAILRLPTAVSMTLTVRTVELPTPLMNQTDFFSSMTGVVSGFGKTSDGPWDVGSNKLLMAKVNITSFEYCQKFWSSAIEIIPTQICSLPINRGSTCQGDSGGPLTVSIDKKAFVIGITSFGEARCLKRVPSVYTNVVSYLDWIQSILDMK